MSLSTELRVVLYNRLGCCLCDDAERMLEQLHAEFDFVLQHVNIDEDPVLKQKLRCQIPVVTINGGNRVALRITQPRLRRAFQRVLQRDIAMSATSSSL